MQTEYKKLKRQKQKIMKESPPLTEVIRGTFIKCYLKCIRTNCKCHKDKKYRHGPQYRVSYGKGNKMHHVYVPLDMKKEVEKWTANYRKLWQGIEDISALNIKIIRRLSRRK